MYDIIRLIKKIYYSYPPKFWLTILFVFALLILIRPIGNTIIDIISPPAPTATPRPTPDINQTVKIGEPALILDTYYSILGWQEYDSFCNPLKESKLDEPTKTIVIEFWARHLGKDPVDLNNFYVRDNIGMNYLLTASEKVGDYNGTCIEPLSKSESDISNNVKLNPGYGTHMYLYARNIPINENDLELTFQISYIIPYAVTGTPTPGSSKAFVKLTDPGTFVEPSAMLMGAPYSQNLSKDRTFRIDDIAVAIHNVDKLAGDNEGNEYYLELLIQNVSDEMLNFNPTQEFMFSVIDAYGVPLPAGMSFNMNYGYNTSLAPGETQKYYMNWQMEQKSVKMESMYLRFSRKGKDTVGFIEIPFKESMLAKATATPMTVEYLYRTPVPQLYATPQRTIATEVPKQCVNTLPPRLRPGDTASVTYTPPVANRLRGKPGFSGGIITTISPGRTFYVIDGPVCADNLYWYYVSFGSYTGWTAESDKGQYWLEKK